MNSTFNEWENVMWSLNEVGGPVQCLAAPLRPSILIRPRLPCDLACLQWPCLWPHLILWPRFSPRISFSGPAESLPFIPWPYWQLSPSSSFLVCTSFLIQQLLTFSPCIQYIPTHLNRWPYLPSPLMAWLWLTPKLGDDAICVWGRLERWEKTSYRLMFVGALCNV